MERALKIFLPTFVIVFVFNQMAYGSCFEGYCIAAAFPKVTILSVFISAFIYWVSKNEESNK
jgi:hypothetical protein